MCTASWLIHPAGYELFFNRDERRERAPALGPRVHEVDGVSFLAPVDGDAGGTWFGVNAFGVSVALLNGWGAGGTSGAETSADYRSRGLLVLELLPAHGQDAARERLRRQDLERYRSFDLLVFEPGTEPIALAWDGAGLRDVPAEMPMVSSSLDRTRARDERVELLDQMRGRPYDSAAERLLAYHSSHEPERGPWSPCMHRKDASTVSASRVRVTAERASFGYAAGPPCRTAWDAPLLLDRVPRSRGPTLSSPAGSMR